MWCVFADVVKQLLEVEQILHGEQVNYLQVNYLRVVLSCNKKACFFFFYVTQCRKEKRSFSSETLVELIAKQLFLLRMLVLKCSFAIICIR